jgi:hypothetical protein
MAPELLQPEPEADGNESVKRTNESDVYALGCVFLEVSPKKKPYIIVLTFIAVLGFHG